MSDTAEDKIMIIRHIDGCGHAHGKVFRRLGHEVADGICYIDLHTALILDINNPFYGGTVFESGVIKMIDKDPLYICLIAPDEITDKVITAWIEYRLKHTWNWNCPLGDEYLNTLFKTGKVSSDILSTYWKVFLPMAIKHGNTKAFKEILHNNDITAMSISFWKKMHKLIVAGDNETALEFAETLITSKVDTFQQCDHHHDIVILLHEKNLVDKYYDLIAFIAKIYKKHVNSYFYEHISECTSLVQRLYRDKVLYDGKNTITTPEDLLKELTSIMCRYHPAE